jgi:hypothetical protein
MDGHILVVLPRADMLDPVQEFIKQLELKRIQKQPRKPETADELLDRLESRFRSEIELFARDARYQSLTFMHAILARWNELARDPDITTLPNTLAIAVEIELDALRAETAADALRATA